MYLAIIVVTLVLGVIILNSVTLNEQEGDSIVRYRKGEAGLGRIVATSEAIRRANRSRVGSDVGAALDWDRSHRMDSEEQHETGNNDRHADADSSTGSGSRWNV